MGYLHVYLLAGLLGACAVAVGVEQGTARVPSRGLYAGVGLVAAGLVVIFPGVVADWISALV